MNLTTGPIQAGVSTISARIVAEMWILINFMLIRIQDPHWEITDQNLIKNQEFKKALKKVKSKFNNVYLLLVYCNSLRKKFFFSPKYLAPSYIFSEKKCRKPHTSPWPWIVAGSQSPIMAFHE